MATHTFQCQIMVTQVDQSYEYFSRAFGTTRTYKNISCMVATSISLPVVTEYHPHLTHKLGNWMGAVLIFFALELVVQIEKMSFFLVQRNDQILEQMDKQTIRTARSSHHEQDCGSISTFGRQIKDFEIFLKV